MKKIKLTQGKWALVDDEDFEYLNQWRWFAYKNKKRFYAGRYWPAHERTSPKLQVRRMHTEITGYKLTDHINLDSLDNRRSNLREATNGQNIANRLVSSATKTGYKGVDFYKSAKKFRARITCDKKCYNLGLFNTPEDAYAAYKKAAKDLHGEFARW